MYQAGTLSGNPLATAAGLAVLSAPRPGGLRPSWPTGSSASPAGCGPPWATPGGPNGRSRCRCAGPLLGVFFASEPVVDYDGAKASADTGRYPALMHGLLDRGVAIAPGAYEVLFPSLAHDEDVLEDALAIFAATAASLTT